MSAEPARGSETHTAKPSSAVPSLRGRSGLRARALIVGAAGAAYHRWGAGGGAQSVIRGVLSRTIHVRQDFRVNAMRTGVLGLTLIALAACESTAERICSDRGLERDTSEFRECVAARRTEEGMRIKEQAAQGTGRGRLGQ